MRVIVLLAPMLFKGQLNYQCNVMGILSLLLAYIKKEVWKVTVNGVLMIRNDEEILITMY